MLASPPVILLFDDIYVFVLNRRFGNHKFILGLGLCCASFWRLVASLVLGGDVYWDRLKILLCLWELETVERRWWYFSVPRTEPVGRRLAYSLPRRRKCPGTGYLYSSGE